MSNSIDLANVSEEIREFFRGLAENTEADTFWIEDSGKLACIIYSAKTLSIPEDTGRLPDPAGAWKNMPLEIVKQIAEGS